MIKDTQFGNESIQIWKTEQEVLDVSLDSCGMHVVY
jgi:hypothetical protein